MGFSTRAQAELDDTQHDFTESLKALNLRVEKLGVLYPEDQKKLAEATKHIDAAFAALRGLAKS